MTESRPCEVTTTTDARVAADELARSAVEARLAACAQVFGPITSTYRWQGAVEEASEWTVRFKTTTDLFTGLAQHIRDRHGYQTPEILCTPVLDGDPAYLGWLRDQVRPA